MVVAHYLGVPEEDRDRFDGWTDAIVGATSTDDTARPARHRRADGVLHRLVDLRRREPGDDTVSHLVMAGEGDDDAGVMRVLAFTFTMVAGGNDTTTGLLGSGVQLLAERPDQRAWSSGTSLVGRGAAPTHLTRAGAGPDHRPRRRDRRRTDPGRPQGAALLRGRQSRPSGCTGPTPSDLDVTRDPRQILSFSHGAHHCLGAAAARMMARVDPHRAAAAVPDFTVDPASIRWAPGTMCAAR